MKLDNLSPVMQERAKELKELFPAVVYTSGSRDRVKQAKAMAANVVTDRRWIRKVYVQAARLQTMVDLHPEAVTVDDLQDLLLDELDSMSDEELAKLSDHFTGNAVDVKPMEVRVGKVSMPTEAGLKVIDWIENCPDTKWFTTREGGMVRWHWATKPLRDTVPV